MNIPDGLRYTKDHEWVRLEDGEKTATVGITDYAQESLGDVTFVELPDPGASLAQGKTFGVVESVKAVSDLYAPISGEIVEINEAVVSRPELLNEDPYAKAWLLKVKVASIDKASLLSPDQYKALVEEA